MARTTNFADAGRGFRFESRWDLGPVSAIEAAQRLVDLAAYPSWWRQVRSVERVTDDVARVRIRSALPYALNLLVTREVADVDGGRLRVGLAGDLTGWAEVTLSDAPSSRVVVDYRQEVVVTAPVLGRVAWALRTPLRANHAAMMRSGEKGLRRLLRG